MKTDVMKLEMLGPELNKQLGVELHAVQNEPGNPLFSFDFLRKLTRQYVGKQGDFNRLCELLNEAEEAAARGDLATKARFLSAYIDEVSAQAQQLDLSRKLIFKATLTLMRYPRRAANR